MLKPGYSILMFICAIVVVGLTVAVPKVNADINSKLVVYAKIDSVVDYVYGGTHTKDDIAKELNNVLGKEEGVNYSFDDKGITITFNDDTYQLPIEKEV